jgi:hypothetical protein
LDEENKKCQILVENLMEEIADTSVCIRETGIMRNAWET